MVRVCVDCNKYVGSKAPLDDTRITGTFCIPCKEDRMDACRPADSFNLYCVAVPLALFLILI